jgi:hypothetical protein
MSALGQKQTFAVQKGMSALPPKATSNATYEMSTSEAWANAMSATKSIFDLHLREGLCLCGY